MTGPAKFRRPRTLLVMHTALMVGTLAVMGFAPPASGRMIVIPLFEAAPGDAFTMVSARGALPIGGGPVAGSLVVEGERGALLLPLLSRGYLLLAGTGAGCGTSPNGEAAR